MDRDLTTPLFILRAVQLGLSLRDIDQLTVGFIDDMLVESMNDTVEYDQRATQDDFNRF